MGKGYSAEQIVRKLRQAEGKLAAGYTIPEVARELGISEATFHLPQRYAHLLKGVGLTALGISIDPIVGCKDAGLRSR